MKFTEICTHPRPDIDEILAWAILKAFGERCFPGISTAKMTFANPEDPFCDGQMAETLGTIMVGVGHGRFDEHPQPGGTEKDGECAASLVAKHLGCFDDPAWTKLMQFTTKNDLKGQGGPFDIAYLPKVMFQRMGHDDVVKWMQIAIWAIFREEAKNFQMGRSYNPEIDTWIFDRILAAWLQNTFGDEKLVNAKLIEFIFEGDQNEPIAIEKARQLGVAQLPALQHLLKFAGNNPSPANLFNIKGIPALVFRHNEDIGKEYIVDWTMTAIGAKYQEQVDFLGKTRAEFEKKAQVKKIRGPGKELVVVIVDECDNQQMNKYCRSKEGGRAAIVVQRQMSGNTQIFSNKNFRLDFHDLTAMLRLAEQEARDEMETDDWKDLRCEGMLAYWYFHQEGQMLLNGSSKAKVASTRLTLEQIFDLICIAMNPLQFEPTRFRECRKGNCTGNRRQPCPWYAWGLRRCCTTRNRRIKT